MKARAVAMTVVTLALVSGLSADTWHVETTGSDEHTGRSITEAFATLGRAVAEAKPGDTVLVGPGRYHEEVRLTRDGTPDNPITIKARYPHRTILDGSVRIDRWTRTRGRRNTWQATVDKPTYLVYEKDTDTEYLEMANLHDLDRTPGSFMTDPKDKLLYVHPSDSKDMAHHVVDAAVLDYGIVHLARSIATRHTDRRRHIVIEGLVFTGYNTAGVWIQNADHVHVRNCIAHHNRRGIFFFSAYRSSIAGCEAFANADRYMQEYGNIGIMSYVVNCLLENNTVYDTRQYGIRFYGGFSGCIMRGNLAWRCNAAGIHVKGRILTDAQLERIVANSTDEAAARLPMIFERNTAHRCSSWSLIGNFCELYHNTGVGALQRGDKKVGNLFVDLDRVAEARFVDPDWHDLRLQENSPHRGDGPDGKTPGAHPYRGEVLFVKPEGDDTASGRSVEAAFKTLARAVGDLREGQTLYLLPGTYAEPLLLDGLTDVTVRAHGGHGATIDSPRGVVVRGCRNVAVEGLCIRGAATGVTVGQSPGTVVRRCEVIDNGTGISLAGSPGVRLLHNTVCFNNRGGASAEALEDVHILGNIIRDNKAYPVRTPPAPLPESFHCNYNNLGGRPVVGDRAMALADWRGLGPDRRSIDVPAGFVDAGKRDLRLVQDSPCRGRGLLDKPIGPGRIVPAAGGVVLADVQVTATSPTTVDIAWSSHGGRTTTVVRWGTGPDQLNHERVLDTGHHWRYHHLVTLTDLEPGTRYHFKVGYRELLDGGFPYHKYNYSWPGKTPEGEAQYYAGLNKRDVLSETTYSFTTGPVEHEPTVYAVAPGGDDDAAGTEAAPWRSLAKACREARPGDRVVVEAGTYYESIRPVRSGLPGKPIVFEARRGARVVLSGKRLLVPTGADLTNRRHIVIRGFIFQEQAQRISDGSAGAQAYIVNAEGITVERCVFDGRMNYLFPIYVYRSRDVTIRHNIIVSHWSALIAPDNTGTLTIDHNTFLGPTIHKIYAVRNNHVVITNNIFGENLFPKKKKQYKVVVIANRSVEADHNAYVFDPKNDLRRLVDYGVRDIDLATVKPLPDDSKGKVRFGISGKLAMWQETFGQDRHSVVTTDTPWKDAALVDNLRMRRRGWPNRFWDYDPFSREALSLKDDSPLRGAGSGGSDIGAETSYK